MSLARRRLHSRVSRTAARMVDHAARHDLGVAELATARLPWFEVRDGGEGDGPPPDVTTVLLFDEIGGSFGVDAKGFVAAVEGIDSPTIHLRINSPGGAVFDAIAMHSALLHHPARVVVFVDSLAASAASVVAMAGDEIVMMPGSQMMIHDAAMVLDGNASDAAKAATFLNRQSDNVAGLYARRAGGKPGDWRQLMLDETWMFADEAVSIGLADRVEETASAGRDERMARTFDLSEFRFAGREHAPTPSYRTAAERAAEVRSTGTRPVQQSGRRASTLTRVEVRTQVDGAVHVEGHAAVFDAPTWIGPAVGGFEERVARGAFRKTISDGADVRFLFNHNPDLVLARSKSRTLTLAEDGIGLLVGADLAPTTVGRDLAVLLERGDVTEMSFGFQVIKDVWERLRRDDGSEYERRTILEARLFDVSAVTYPAYDETDLAIREAQLARELRTARQPKISGPPEPPDGTPPDLKSTADSPANRGAFSCPEPAEVTPKRDGDRSLRPLDLIVRHAAGDHTGSPRVLCPACTRLQPPPGTDA